MRNTYKLLKLYTSDAVPTFTEGDVLKIVIPIDTETNEDLTIKGSKETSGVMSGKIIQFMIKNKHITIPELAKEKKVSERTIYRNISKLEKEHRIEKIGPDKSGTPIDNW